MTQFSEVSVVFTRSNEKGGGEKIWPYYPYGCMWRWSREKERCNSVKLMSLAFFFFFFFFNLQLYNFVCLQHLELFGLRHMRHISLELISLGKIENSLWMPFVTCLGLMEPKLSFLFVHTYVIFGSLGERNKLLNSHNKEGEIIHYSGPFRISLQGTGQL